MTGDGDNASSETGCVHGCASSSTFRDVSSMEALSGSLQKTGSIAQAITSF